MVNFRNYTSEFINEYGEKWVFEYDSIEGKGTLKGSDVDWQEFSVVDGRAMELNLTKSELKWLRKAWQEASN